MENVGESLYVSIVQRKLSFYETTDNMQYRSRNLHTCGSARGLSEQDVKYTFLFFVGNSYKFKLGTRAAALTWYTYVRQATKEKQDLKVSLQTVLVLFNYIMLTPCVLLQIPQNLITFEESEEQQS